MLPLLILVAPPTAAGGGYLSRSAGQRLILLDGGTRSSTSSSPSACADEAPPNTLASNVAGLAALAGTYGAAEYLLGRSEPSGGAHGSTSSSSGTFHTKTTASAAGTGGGGGGGGGGKFVQPKGIGDLLSRVGPPVLMRLGAASFAFFCAGAVQTYVASRSLEKELKQK